MPGPQSIRHSETPSPGSDCLSKVGVYRVPCLLSHKRGSFARRTCCNQAPLSFGILSFFPLAFSLAGTP
ncbi:hypothetical protein FHW16_005562 [Phyllobacterium myrsinacearum]|uniref:Uncharacterized protein n=1 Tax=Phyllobacterium myrsinacearum TaxID=28101 RepID=A0A839EUN3_9HYPH|nr:hypothetical protein [Phyllobacterium myrsinacearum]